MGLLLFTLIAIAIVVAAVIGAMVVSALPRARSLSDADKRRLTLQVRTYQRTLRAIANGTTGNPVLEAQIALDEGERAEYPELGS